MTLVYLGNAALRRMSKSVGDVRAPAVKQLLQSMEQEVRKEAGVGLAAPQLGHNLRMFLMLKNPPQSQDDIDDAHEKFEYQPVINPQIVEMSKQSKKDFEGCLSIPGYMAVVSRAKEIKVTFQDAAGKSHQQTLRDFSARIFQHEMDHLDGVLYVDRMEPKSLIHNEEFESMEWMDIQKLLRD